MEMLLRTFTAGDGQGDLTAATAQALAATLAYEPSTARDVFGDACMEIWLDSGRFGVPGERSAKRMWTFATNLKDPPTGIEGRPWVVDPADGQLVIDHLSAKSRQIAAAADDWDWDFEWARDDAWAANLIKLTNAEEPGWALVIVGAMHATLRNEHTLRSQLQAAHRTCLSTYAGFAPPPAWNP